MGHYVSIFETHGTQPDCEQVYAKEAFENPCLSGLEFHRELTRKEQNALLQEKIWQF
jgi:hypothetical protein